MGREREVEGLSEMERKRESKRGGERDKEGEGVRECWRERTEPANSSAAHRKRWGYVTNASAHQILWNGPHIVIHAPDFHALLKDAAAGSGFPGSPAASVIVRAQRRERGLAWGAGGGPQREEPAGTQTGQKKNRPRSRRGPPARAGPSGAADRRA